MAQIPDITVLIQDLLSPASVALPSTTPQLISYHLSAASIDDASSIQLVTSLVSYITTSPALWRGQANKVSLQWSRSIDFERARQVYTALFQGCLYRAGELTRLHGTGWSARRKFAAFLDAYCAGFTVTPGVQVIGCHPTIRVLAASAALRAMQAIKSRKDKLYVGGSALMGRAEDEVIEAWREYFNEWDRNGRVEGPSGSKGPAHEWTGSSADHASELPTWLAAQTFPMITVDKLADGSIADLLPMLSSSFSRVFAAGRLFDELESSLHSAPEGLTWTVPSESHTHLSALVQAPLFVALGPLSRSIGRLIEASGKRATAAPNDPTALAAVVSFVLMLERLSQRVQRGWSSTSWSEVAADSELSAETQRRTEPWSLLKSLLFSVTLVHSSLLVIVTPHPGIRPTDLQIDLAKQATRVLSRTYFITIKFGTDGFNAWRGAWLGLMELARMDTDRGAEKLMEELEPPRLGQLQERVVDRSVTTFYLNAAEQLMRKLGNEYVELRVLRCCHPYLENPGPRDTFESAHSVLLAVFATAKPCATDLAPFYIQLLLRAYPRLMSASQLRLAYTAVVRCASGSDDALAWYCILQLIEDIRKIEPGTLLAPPGSSISNAQDVPPSASSTPREYDDEAAQTRIDEAASLSPLERQALTLRRGHLLLALIDQTTSCNLVLLRKLLDQIWTFVKEERQHEGAAVTALAPVTAVSATRPSSSSSAPVEEEEPGSAVDALVKVLFSTLGEGLDATKREEGVRYWLERSEELASRPLPGRRNGGGVESGRDETAASV